MFLPIRLVIPAALMAAMPMMVQAQPTPHEETRMMQHHHNMGQARLTVSGEGQANVQPDMATISLGVTSQAATATEAMAANSTQQAAVIEALRAEGIEARDIQTSGLSLSATMDYSEGRAPVITGYQAQNMVTVRVRDLPRLGEVLDSLVQSGANEVQGISFQREDSQNAADEARTNAVAEARRRAEVLAAAAGMELGRLISIKDAAGGMGPQPMMMRAQAEASASVPIEAGELTITAQVETVFALVAPDNGNVEN